MRYPLTLLLYGVILFVTGNLAAQENRVSPEMEQMYRHASEYMSRGNYKEAIVTYRNAIVLTPGKKSLHADLGKALYLNGNYDEAENVLKPLVKKNGANAETYRFLALSLSARDKTKQAKKILDKGVANFPDAGALYHEKGNLYFADRKPETALDAWLSGIKKDPGYSRNYYEAAHIYFNSDDVLWGILYAEIYLNIDQDTTGAQTFKNDQFKAYKTMFDNIAAGASPKPNRVVPANNFTDAVKEIYRSLTPVVSDGISSENLAMVRARFLMDWFAGYAAKYPFSLFSHMDGIIRNGYFDMYNEWLFGVAENELQHEAWDKFHPGDLQRLGEWMAGHPLHPVVTDFYNNKGGK